MLGVRHLAETTGCWVAIICSIASLDGQTCLTMSRPTIAADGTASLDLLLYSRAKTAPAALQWTVQDPSSSITGLSLNDGPALTAAKKTTVCLGAAAAYTCMAMGANANAIANGTIAKLTFSLPPGVTVPAIEIKDAMAVSPTGYFINIRVSADCRPQPGNRRPAD